MDGFGEIIWCPQTTMSVTSPQEHVPETESFATESSREASLTSSDAILEYPQSQRENVEEGHHQPVASYNEVEEITSTFIEPELYRGATIGDRTLFEDMLQDQEGIERIAKLVTPQMNTVLHVAASFGKINIVELVHKHCPSLVMRTNSRRDTALHDAARDGHLSVVKFLIKSFAGDIEMGTLDVSEGLLRMKNVEGNTALHEATRNGHEMVAQLLIEQDQELANFVNNFGESPFYLAAEAGLSKLVAELSLMPLDHMIQEIQERRTALHAAISREHTETVRILLRNIPKLRESRDIYERSPLHYAAYCGYRQAITLLLQGHVSIAHHRDYDGMSPIHLAALNGHLTVFQELLKQCPDSRELLNNKLQNALHVASESRKENMVAIILGNPELEKLINERDVDGNTPLHLATRHGHATIVSALVRYTRVDLTIKNNEGHTAYDVAELRATSESSFAKILSAVALKSANAPRGYSRLIYKRCVQEGTAEEEMTETKNLRHKNSMRNKINTLLLVSTLIVTITFAAGIVVPGGEKTTHHLSWAFQVYVISNSIAMYSSIIAAIMLIWGYLRHHNFVGLAFGWSMLILGAALIMLAVAFGAGVYLVVSDFVWFGLAVLIISTIYLFSILAIFISLQIRVPIVVKYRLMGFISKVNIYILLKLTSDPA